jgi:N-dimethylarginine dimethylaminohydrolase
MTGFGAQDMVGPLRRVLLRRPGAAMAQADPTQWHYAGKLDAAKLDAQHDAFCALLGDAGAELAWLADDDGLADAVFTFDPSLVTEAGAVILNPGKELRQGETALHEAAYAALDIPVLGRIAPPGTLEGGDCLWLDRGTLAVGRGFRSNAAGIAQLGDLLRPPGVTLHVFDLPYGDGPAACLHLLSLISLLDRDLALVHLPLLPVALHELLRARNVQIIETPADEFTASRGLSCNVLALRPRHGAMIAGQPKTQAALEAAGCTIATFPGDELCLKTEGGPTCLTRPVLRG